MDKIKVSVVIPVYNVEKYLEECLDSIVNQTLREMEIICVNDGSTDRSPEILQKYAANDNRIIICTQKNCGISAARNKGVSRACGKYLYFMDSDDILELSALRILYEKSEADNLDVLYFEADAFTKDPKYKDIAFLNSKTLKRKFSYEGIQAGYELLSKMVKHGDFRVNVWSQLISRSYYMGNNLTFYEGLATAEDQLLNYECMLKAKRVEHLPLQLIHYRKHPDSITAREKSFANAYTGFTCYLKMSQFYREQNLSDLGDELLYQPVKRVLENLQKNYMRLSPEEKQKVSTLPDDMRQLFEMGVIEVCNERLKPDFRIGAAILWFPRKLIGVVRCYMQFGLIYTIKRVFWHVTHLI